MIGDDICRGGIFLDLSRREAPVYQQGQGEDVYAVLAPSLTTCSASGRCCPRAREISTSMGSPGDGKARRGGGDGVERHAATLARRAASPLRKKIFPFRGIWPCNCLGARHSLATG